MSRLNLAPTLLPMRGNRCYRLNEIHEDFQEQLSAQRSRKRDHSHMTYIEPGDTLEGACDQDEANYLAEHCQEIDEIDTNVYRLNLHVPTAFYGTIIGTKATTKRRLEMQTRTTITIPSRTSQQSSSGGGGGGGVSSSADAAVNPEGGGGSSSIIIQGDSRLCVYRAKRSIEAIISSSRSRIKATHFYGLPMNTEEFQKRFQVFQKEVMDAQLPGIDASFFQLSTHLHLTFGVCILLDAIERKKAMEILQSCRELLMMENDTQLKSLKIRVRGIDIMNDDPSNVRVLYAQVDLDESSPLLQKFANDCMERFRASGLTTMGNNNNNNNNNVNSNTGVKLHMTLMNARYGNKASSSEGDEEEVEERSQQNNNNNNKFMMRRFDAREILKRWSNFDFGCVSCEELVLCPIGASKVDESFYKITDSLRF